MYGTSAVLPVSHVMCPSQHQPAVPDRLHFQQLSPLQQQNLPAIVTKPERLHQNTRLAGLQSCAHCLPTVFMTPALPAAAACLTPACSRCPLLLPADLVPAGLLQTYAVSTWGSCTASCTSCCCPRCGTPLPLLLLPSLLHAGICLQQLLFLLLLLCLVWVPAALHCCQRTRLTSQVTLRQLHSQPCQLVVELLERMLALQQQQQQQQQQQTGKNAEEEEELHGVHRQLCRNKHPNQRRAARTSAKKQAVTQRRPTPRTPLYARHDTWLECSDSQADGMACLHQRTQCSASNLQADLVPALHKKPQGLGRRNRTTACTFPALPDWWMRNVASAMIPLLCHVHNLQG
jgi:hypothetical protein